MVQGTRKDIISVVSTLETGNISPWCEEPVSSCDPGWLALFKNTADQLLTIRSRIIQFHNAKSTYNIPIRTASNTDEDASLHYLPIGRQPTPTAKQSQNAYKLVPILPTATKRSLVTAIQ